MALMNVLLTASLKIIFLHGFDSVQMGMVLPSDILVMDKGFAYSGFYLKNIGVYSAVGGLISLWNAIAMMFYFEWLHFRHFLSPYIVIDVSFYTANGSEPVFIPGTSLFATAFATLVWLWLFFAMALVGKFALTVTSAFAMSFEYLHKKPTVILWFGVLPCILIAILGIIVEPLIVATAR
jgi:hypothetical protein